jgi:AmpD protein
VIIKIKDGWLTEVQRLASPHFNKREVNSDGDLSSNKNIRLLVIHNISLPPAQFGGSYISDLFLGQLDTSADPYFEQLSGVQVSAHCLIRRDGEIIQYVSFDDKAWHAGVSTFEGQQGCNDFSIGIELEGTDDIAYTNEQYQQLTQLVKKIQESYPLISHNNIVGHCDIAPKRKTDPGQSFDWALFRQSLK